MLRTSLRIRDIHRCSPTSGSYQPWRNLITLAIETSCDDTAVAILQCDGAQQNSSKPNAKHDSLLHESQTHASSLESTNESGLQARLLFNDKVTARNTGLGGIHPIEALESHQANLSKLISRAIQYLPDAPETFSGSSAKPSRTIHLGNGTSKQLPDFVSVTRGPGMRSNLTCGLDTAKGLSAAWQIPLIGVHHMQAHALTPRLVNALEKSKADEDQKPRFPFLTLLISGGHTMLLRSNSLVDHEILATTRDVAIGDALDKCGRIILPSSMLSELNDTAFARYLSEYAFQEPEDFARWPVPSRRSEEIDKPNNQFGWQVQAPLADTRELAFSFSGLATSVERIFKNRTQLSDAGIGEEERLLFARTTMGIAFEHLASRTIIALQELKSSQQDISTLVVSGGVAANPFLRHFLRAMLDLRGFQHIELLFPPPWLCTDNAAMIAWCGMEMFAGGFRSELDVGALRKWSMDRRASDGGILGVTGWTRVD